MIGNLLNARRSMYRDMELKHASSNGIANVCILVIERRRANRCL